MSEAQPTPPSNTRGPRRGRGGRSGRGRGARGHHHGPSERLNDEGQGSQTAPAPRQPVERGTVPVVGASSEASNTAPVRNDDEGNWRGRRRGRGSASGQRSVVVSHRGRARPAPAAASSEAGGLSAAAAEFVPGQAVASSRWVFLLCLLWWFKAWCAYSGIVALRRKSLHQNNTRRKTDCPSRRRRIYPLGFKTIFRTGITSA